jgi:ATP-dependent protease HslVU (ClpYQ) peptidase subunit
MTAIVGMVYRDYGMPLPHDYVYMAGDGIGVGSDGSVQPRRNKKVFTTGEFVIGYAGSYRVGQVIEHQFVPPSLDRSSGSLQSYMVSFFIPALMEAMANHSGVASDDASNPFGANLLVGVRGMLFGIESDYQVSEPDSKFWAIGAGADLCLGAMSALVGNDGDWVSSKDVPNPTKILGDALSIAARFDTSVGPPFMVAVT